MVSSSKRPRTSNSKISKEEIERRKQQSLGETIKNKGYPLCWISHAGRSFDGETKVALNLRESKVDIEPESHAPSSSSAAMPTNQMITDELVSLRGYITTRMDAFDTQSQQIHYELHRLSSRLSNMDVEEDSSEPES
ncbi:hypothetical protein Lal_00027226 [Lupinus albus]|nr:hypothetical protein Lal_00027226 [Lupinus albus]